MIPEYFHVFKNPKTGRYKVMVVGRADGHIMDWRGCNFRITPVDGQPRRGFLTYEEAKAFEKAIEADPIRKEIEFKKCRYTGGTFLNDEGKAGNWEF